MTSAPLGSSTKLEVIFVLRGHLERSRNILDCHDFMEENYLVGVREVCGYISVHGEFVKTKTYLFPNANSVDVEKPYFIRVDTRQLRDDFLLVLPDMRSLCLTQNKA